MIFRTNGSRNIKKSIKMVKFDKFAKNSLFEPLLRGGRA
jgi:hypothetical protein